MPRATPMCGVCARRHSSSLRLQAVLRALPPSRLACLYCLRFGSFIGHDSGSGASPLPCAGVRSPCTNASCGRGVHIDGALRVLRDHLRPLSYL